jgi:alkylhydroperoxidase family enzyme
MARMRPLTKAEVPEGEVRDALEAGEKWLGHPAVGAGIQAHAPEIMKASRALGAAPGKSGLLPPQLRSLVCLRAAEMVGCPF